MKRKVLLIAISYLIGTIWGLYVNKYIALFLYVLLMVYYIVTKKSACKFFIIVAFMCSSLLAYNKNLYADMLYTNKENTVLARVLSVQEDELQQKITVKAIKIGKRRAKKYTKFYIYAKKNTVKCSYGQIIKFNGEFSEIEEQRNYKGFNYKKYLQSKNVYGLVKCENVSIVNSKKQNMYLVFINNLQKKIKNIFYKYLPKNNSEMAVALILGKKDNLDDHIVNAFSESSLSHILAISGMHVAYVASIIKICTSKFSKRKSYLITIVALIFFCNLANNTESVFRATVMLILYYASKLLHRKSDSLTNLAIATILSIVINPFCIYSAGFILSSVGTLGIILFNNPLNTKIQINNKILKYIKEQIILGVSANILLAPIVAVMFNKFSLIFLLSSPVANLLLSILMPTLICFIIGAILMDNSLQIIVKFVSNIVVFFTNNLINLSEFFSKFKFLNTIVITPSYFKIVVYYVLVSIIFTKKNINKRNLAKFILGVYLIICILSKFIIFIDNTMEIHFVDVGQGDCSYIITPKKHSILIDGGGKELGEDTVGKNILLPYLLSRSTKKLDYVIVSHCDSDHVGGILYILQKIKVKNIIVSKPLEISENYKKLISLANKHNINIIYVKAGDKINVEKDFCLKILWPDVSNLISENSINNNSIMCKLEYKNFSILFTGDVEEKTENEILAKYKQNLNILNADVLKVAHHGSKSSSCKEFLEAVKPKIALIGVGANNTFGHPSNITLENLEKIRCKIYRTDKNGEITIQVNKKGEILIDKIY